MPDLVGSIDLSPIKNVTGVGSNSLSISGIIATIFKTAIPIAGALLLLLLLYGGFTYLTAAGNDDQVEKAKKIMTQAVIGIIIVAFSFGIGLWIIGLLGINSTIGGTGTNTQQSPTANVTVKTNTKNANTTAKCTSCGTSPTAPHHATGVFKPYSSSNNSVNNAVSTSLTNIVQAQSITGDYSGSGTVVVNNPTNNVSSTDSITGDAAINNTQVKSCPWYKKYITQYLGAHCPDATSQTQPTTVINSQSSPTATGVETNQPTATGVTSDAPTVVQTASASDGSSMDLTVGSTYELTITATGYKTCTTTTTIDSNNKIIWAKLPTSNESTTCSINLLNNLTPTPGTVNVVTLDESTFKPINGLNVLVQGQQSATATSPGDTNTQYLKGQTSGQGTTIFHIDQPGLRAMTVQNGSNGAYYFTCTSSVFLSAGVNVTLFMNPLTGGTSSTTKDCQPNIITPPPASSVPTAEKGTNNPNLPQPANDGTVTPSTNNLPQPAVGSDSSQTFIPSNCPLSSEDPDMSGWSQQRINTYCNDKIATQPRGTAN